MKVVFVFALLLIATIYCQGQNWKNCMEDPPFLVDNLVVEPSEIKRDIDINITITGELRNIDLIKAGNIDMPVFFKGSRVFHYKYDLCQVTVGGCPISKGPGKVFIKQRTPKIAFKGRYTVIAKTFDSTGRQIACVEYFFDLQQ